MASQFTASRAPLARLLAREVGASAGAAREVSSPRSRTYASTSASTGSTAPASSRSSRLSSLYASQRNLSTSSAVLANGASASSTLPSSSRPANSSTSPPAGDVSAAPPTSPLKSGLIGSIAKLMGYDANTSAAIRVSSDYYDRCSERDEKEATFWYEECGLPVSYQSWMQITNLHIWLVSVRFRSLPASVGRTYIQEIVNHYFIHAESLMRGRYKVKQNRLIKGYMRDMLYQYHGANMGYDEGLVSGSDAVLAAAIWRNLFGAGWGHMAGVKGKHSKDAKNSETQTDSLASKAESAVADLDPGTPPNPDPVASIPNQAGGYHAGGSGLVEHMPPNDISALAGIETKDVRFAVNLERLTRWIRGEVRRMENLSDEAVMQGAGLDRVKGISKAGSLTDFSRI